MTSVLCDYRFAYGLRITSEFALPELPGSAPHDQPDVCIELGETLARSEVQHLVSGDDAVENVMRFDNNSSRVLFTEVGRFTVRDGSHVLVEPLEGTSASSWRLPLLGSILALLLEQRGWLALHAGAVQMTGPNGNPIACAFAGEKGQGKSTLGAALSVAGFPLLCDDVLALDLSSPSSPPRALLGFGGIKLVPDAVRAVLNVSPDELPEVAPELSEGNAFDKRHFLAPIAETDLPLRHIFLLASHDEAADRDAVMLRALSPQESLLLLFPHTFAARWGEFYLKGEVRSTHFKACAQVVGNCRIWELSRRRDLTLLPHTIELLARTARETA